MMGIATVRDGFPLYYDCVTEAGVAAAALNFPISAKYADFRAGKLNLASFEIIPYVLGRCADLGEVRKCLADLNVTAIAFSEELAATPLHWIFADKSGSLVLESTAEGIKIYENTVGVLTNEPGFDYQLTRLADYMGLGSMPPQNNFSSDFEPCRYSRGLGGFGLPGDFSSSSRFVRATFVKNHISTEGAGKIERFFHILGSVAVPRGCVMTDGGREVETVYRSCVDLDERTYHYSTYSSPEIRFFRLGDSMLDGERLIRYAVNI